MDECMAMISPRVTHSMNEGLSRIFIGEEVDRAVSQTQPLKGSGPDGYNISFFHHHWETVGDTVRGAALDFLNQSRFDPSINETHVVLIPKSASANSVHDYRPISLCNVLYKIIAKVLANKLKVVLPSIISENQSAFVQGKLISDNILVAYEALHTMAT
jgi:23S rRNA U2552 (ribose-2'-O)-methylase RlmE/FtsJ